jgi:hypothetical protein
MANVNVVVANPTGSAVTSGALTAAPRTLTKLVFDNSSATAPFAFLAAGCAIGPHSGGTVRTRQRAGYLLHMLQGQVAA